MPTRLLREGILDSERVCSLDWAGEVFYRRLMSKVDDHGLYDARSSMLRASLYPLNLDRVREADVSRWIAMCERAGLIRLYEAGGKPYLKMLDTRWQVRSEPKYPLPPPENTCSQPQTLVHLVVDGDVVVDEGNTLSGKPDPVKFRFEKGDAYREKAEQVLAFLNEKASRNYRPVPATLKPIVARLKEGFTVDDCRAVIASKCREWLIDPKMTEFIRPKTLFGAENFANYEGKLGAVS